MENVIGQYGNWLVLEETQEYPATYAVQHEIDETLRIEADGGDAAERIARCLDENAI